VIVRGSGAWQTADPGVVTIGNFDGVHLGHRALLDETRRLARAHGARAVALTFDPAPRDLLRPDNPVVRIQTLKDRASSLLHAGIDVVVVEPFTRELAALSAQDFATLILRDRLNARAVVVGWDFRFGRARGGDAASLRATLGIEVVAVPPQHLGGDLLSSSRIRQALTEGDVAGAARWLGRPHLVRGTVIAGDQRGRTLGFPTANVRPVTPLLPANGVYAVRVDTPTGRGLPGVANVGVRPTFGPGHRGLEVHLLGWEGDLYGHELNVWFVARLREERRFDSAEALLTQIRADAAAAERSLL
jgi:riboflavin kinase/FMN adenylyltransferase